MKTTRQQIIDALCIRPMGAKELSRVVKASIKEVYGHLVHIQKSVQAQGRRLVLEPCCCLACGFAFKDRRRLTPASRCPRCKSSQIQDPVYRIEG